MSNSKFSVSAKSHRRTARTKAAPVAVLFTDEPPIGVLRVDAPALAGRAYWKAAAAGQVFYTDESYELGPQQQAELEQMLSMMTGLKYITMEEVPRIAVRKGKLNFATYAPLAKSPAPPDLVLVRSGARASMLLSEAAHAAGARDTKAPVIRPACAMLPQVLTTGRTTTSLGCIGNRVYTGLPDDEMWQTIPGARLDDIMEKLTAVVQANLSLSKFHEGRIATASI